MDDNVTAYNSPSEEPCACCSCCPPVGTHDSPGTLSLAASGISVYSGCTDGGTSGYGSIKLDPDSPVGGNLTAQFTLEGGGTYVPPNCFTGPDSSSTRCTPYDTSDCSGTPGDVQSNPYQIKVCCNLADPPSATTWSITIGAYVIGQDVAPKVFYATGTGCIPMGTAIANQLTQDLSASPKIIGSGGTVTLAP